MDFISTSHLVFAALSSSYYEGGSATRDLSATIFAYFFLWLKWKSAIDSIQSPYKVSLILGSHPALNDGGALSPIPKIECNWLRYFIGSSTFVEVRIYSII